MTPESAQRPNMLLIGAQKAGSSSLHDYLTLHPDIHMVRRKELHYFDDCFFTETFDAYCAEFAQAGSVKWRSESTPAYLSYPGCAEKIARVLGDVPILVIQRDPISRMYSQYWHSVKYGRETLSFTDALDAEDTRRDTLGMTFFRHFDYLSRSAYETHLDKYRSLFSKVHVCQLEDLSKDPKPVLDGICDFLDIPQLKTVEKQSASNPSGMFRNATLNQALNRYEGRFGSNRVSFLIRRKNFKPYRYPRLTDDERSHAIKRLSETCMKTVTSYGLC